MRIIPRFDKIESIERSERVVSTVIGFVLIFGIIIVSFSVYQAEIVPQQNSEVEFDHLQEIESDLIKLRSSISQTGQTDVRRTTSVRLGTQYPARIFALNPTDPRGSLETSDSHNITIIDDGISMNLSTRFIKYEPDYYEIPSRPIYYENSVLYRQADDPVIIEDQNIVREESPVTMTVLQNDLFERGIERVTTEFYPSTKIRSMTGNLTIEIPTRLGRSYWSNQIDPEIYDGMKINPDVNRLRLEINTDDRSFDLNTIGIGSPPTGENLDSQIDEDQNRSLPSDDVAFDDADGDDQYDETETSYTVEDLKTLRDREVDLTIDRNVTSNQKIDIKVDRLSSDQKISSSKQIKIDAERSIDLSGAIIDSGKNVIISSGGSSVDLRSSIIRFSNEGRVDVKRGTLFVNDDEDGTKITDQRGSSETIKLRGSLSGSPHIGSID